jgi:single-strand DNA-binding protein
MLNLNRASIIGHMPAKPELRTTPNGQPVANFSVATNRRWTSGEGEQQEETEFHDIVAWGKLAEICEQILDKGNLVYLDGRLQTRTWEGQDGNKRQRTEIVADNVINLERRGSGGGGGGSYDQSSKKEDLDQRPSSEKDQPSKKSEDEEIDIDDIPL